MWGMQLLGILGRISYETSMTIRDDELQLPVVSGIPESGKFERDIYWTLTTNLWSRTSEFEAWNIYLNFTVSEVLTISLTIVYNY